MSGEYTVRPVGDVDIVQAEDLRAEWYRVVDGHEPERLVFDVSGVTFLDSAGLSAMAGVIRRQSAHGGTVAVRNASPMILKLLNLTGLDQVIEVLPPDAPHGLPIDRLD